MEDFTSPGCSGGSDTADSKTFDTLTDTDLQFYRADEKGTGRGTEIVMNEPVTSTGLLAIHTFLAHCRKLLSLASWQSELKSLFICINALRHSLKKSLLDQKTCGK